MIAFQIMSAEKTIIARLRTETVICEDPDEQGA